MLEALKYPKINDCTLTELQGMLRACMLLVGIRAANIPAGADLAVLLKFIFGQYGELTLKEFLNAFERAVAGKLDVDPNPFENFTCEYVGRIITAYKKWASRVWNENELHKTTEKQMPANFFETTEMYYQNFLQDRLDLSVMPVENYDACVQGGYIAHDAYEGWMDDAKKSMVRTLRAEQLKTDDLKRRLDMDERIRKIEGGEITIAATALAKKLAVRALYRDAKKQNYPALFEKI